MSRIKRNLGWLLGSQLATWTISIVLLVAAPRRLGANAFGQLSFAMVYVSFFELVALFGTATYLMKIISRDTPAAGRYVWNTLALKFLMSLLLATLAFGLALVLGYDRTTLELIAVYCLGMFLTTMNAALVGGLNGLQQMGRPAAADVARSVTAAALGLLVLVSGGTVLQYAFVTVIACAIPLAMNFAYTMGLLRGTGWQLDIRLWREMLIGGFPFFILAALLVLYGSIDIPLLNALSGDETVGWYTVAYRWVSMPAFFAASVAIAFFPALSAEGTQPSDEFARLANRALYLVGLVALPAAIGIALVADQFISLVYGAEFEQSVPLIRILALHIPIVGMDMVLGSTVIAADRQRQWVLFSVGAAVVNPLLNLVAIPIAEQRFDNGAIGSATVTVLTELILMVGALLLRPSGVFDRATRRILARIVAASLTMVPVVLFLSFAPLVVQVAAGGVTYVLASLLLRTVSLDEVRSLVDQALRRKRDHQPSLPPLPAFDMPPPLPAFDMPTAKIAESASDGEPTRLGYHTGTKTAHRWKPPLPPPRLERRRR